MFQDFQVGAIKITCKITFQIFSTLVKVWHILVHILTSFSAIDSFVGYIFLVNLPYLIIHLQAFDFDVGFQPGQNILKQVAIRVYYKASNNDVIIKLQ